MALQVGPCVRCGFKGGEQLYEHWSLREEGWVCGRCFPEPPSIQTPDVPSKSAELTVQEKRRAYHLFHKVWGEANGGTYVKPDWQELQSLIERVIYVPPDQTWQTTLVNDHGSGER